MVSNSWRYWKSNIFACRCWQWRAFFHRVGNNPAKWSALYSTMFNIFLRCGNNTQELPQRRTVEQFLFAPLYLEKVSLPKLKTHTQLFSENVLKTILSDKISKSAWWDSAGTNVIIWKVLINFSYLGKACSRCLGAQMELVDAEKSMQKNYVGPSP